MDYSFISIGFQLGSDNESIMLISLKASVKRRQHQTKHEILVLGLSLTQTQV